MRKEFLVALIRNCENAAEGRRLHNLISSSDFPNETLLINLLIQMYSRCGCIYESLDTFTEAKFRNVFTWNITMAAQIQASMLDDAKQIFNRMPQRDLVSWNTVLTAFAKERDLQQARLLFLDIPFRNAHSWNSLFGVCARNSSDSKSVEWLFYMLPQHDVISSTLMISALGRFHLLDEATEFFNGIPHRDSVTWNALLHLHAQNKRSEDARTFFDRMPVHGQVSCNLLIAACSEHTESLKHATEVFTGMQSRDPVSWNTLMQAFAANGDLPSAVRTFDLMPYADAFSWTCMITLYSEQCLFQNARDIFDRVPYRDLVVWNAMLYAYAKNGQHNECILLFRSLDVQGMIPDDGTWLAVLEACGGTEVETDFCWKLVEELSGASVLVTNAALRMYSRRGETETSVAMFKLMKHRDVFSWNTMLAFVDSREQLHWFWKMPEHDIVSWNTALGGLRMTSKLKLIPEMNTVSWNAILAGNAREGHVDNVLSLLKTMDLEGFSPNATTLVIVLKACSHTGTLVSSIIREEIMQRDSDVARHVLVNVLGKCGEVEEACKLFESTQRGRDVVAWNGLISSYARNGRCTAGITAYRVMQLEGVEGNETTLTILISACSHSGYLSGGLEYFYLLDKPRLEHYVCMADLFARCGEVELASQVVEMFTLVPECAWTSILSGLSNI